MDEFDLIRRYFAPLASSPGADGLRDDVALIAAGLIVTKDAIVEGVHFLASDPIDTVARKLVRVNVSDIVAKGGRPDAALLALVWPRSRPTEAIGDFARALGEDLARWGAHLAGGDTTSTDGPLTLTLTLVGKVGQAGPVRRSGAKAGQDVWVTGSIGDGWLGLQAAGGALAGLDAETLSALVSRYRVPAPPPLELANLVALHASASIDVSDGLVADAGHIAAASGVALILEAPQVPLSLAGRDYAASMQAGLASLLTGGDDYQTLFTAGPSARAAIAAAGLATRIGSVGHGQGVRLLDASGSEMHLPKGGWTHF